MCLTLEFFKKRGDIYNEYKAKGRIDLDEFLDRYSLSLDDLYKAGLIKKKFYKSTAELYDYELSNEGRKLFVFNSYELFFIKAKLKPEKVHLKILEAIESYKPIIITERLNLRRILYTDVEDLLNMDVDPEVHKYIDNQPLSTIEEEYEVIDYIHEQYNNTNCGRWAVVDKNTGECLGWCGLKYYTTPENGHCNFYELGYRFKRKHWGKGYATESSKAVIDYAINIMKINTIYAMVDKNNNASKHVLDKCGFKFVEIFYDDGQAVEWMELTKD